MSDCDSYVYFALWGDDFDPDEITHVLGVEPTCKWKRSDLTPWGMPRKNASWQLTSARGKEPIWIATLVNEVIEMLESRASLIVELKEQYKMESTLSVILCIDMNTKESTPALGHDLRTINFLYHTQTDIDVDIYRYDSRKKRE